VSKNKSRKGYTLIELIIVIAILAIITSIVSLNVSKFRKTINKIQIESAINEARSILSFGKYYCRKNKVTGMIIINTNNFSFLVSEKGYEIKREIKSIYNLEINSNFPGGYINIDKDGYIKSAGTIGFNSNSYIGTIKIGVGNDIIGVSEVDIIE